MNYQDKNITVLGLAKSGLAAAKKLASLGAKVLVSDVKPADQVDPKILKELQVANIEVELGGHSPKAIEVAEEIIVSPGIHLDIPILEQAKQKGIPIISEIELAYRLINKPIIAVTGTNGKTTTTTLIKELLRAEGYGVVVAGNIGAPLVDVDDRELDYIVAEISSYQLETIKDFKPHVSVILNIQPDHLERHGSMEEYIKQKSRIFMNQTGDDYLVYNQDDPAVVKMVKTAKSRLRGFSKSGSRIITLDPSEIKIPGRHNLENALAAAQAAYICGVDKASVAEILRTFPGVEHRIEFVKNVDGIEFYNDSKATNPDSTLVALETFAGRGIILILGGKDKGTSLDQLGQQVKKLAKEIILIGEARKRFEQELKAAGCKNIRHASSLEDAVRQGHTMADEGDLVLLSPACASFDMFKNFEERGQVFKQVVNEL